MQDTNCYADNLSKIPSSMNLNPYNPPIAEKAQQDPQKPWWVVGHTAPSLVQFIISPEGSAILLSFFNYFI